MSDIPRPLPTWLALGDSYTIGEGVPPRERWPTQLAHHQHAALPQYLAQTGWTTVDLLDAIERTDFADSYDRVSVLIGVNDQYDGLEIDTYQQGLVQILDFAVRRVTQPERVVVVSIPDYSVTPFVQDKDPNRIAREVARFNAVARGIAGAKLTTYCDITEISRRAAHDNALLVADQLHPSGKMYALWAEKIAIDALAR